MATFEPRKVTKPFHLTVEEYQKLFPEFRARGQNVITVALNPITNLSIAVGQTAQEKNELVQHLASRGLKVISVGSDIKDIKEGDLVFMSNREAVSYALKRDIVITDVFPRVRTYVMMMFSAHSIDCFINTESTDLIEIEHEVNITMEEKNYQDALKAIDQSEQNINLFQN